jgi:hypothetical protein
VSVCPGVFTGVSVGIAGLVVEGTSSIETISVGVGLAVSVTASCWLNNVKPTPMTTNASTVIKYGMVN